MTYRDTATGLGSRYLGRAQDSFLQKGHCWASKPFSLSTLHAWGRAQTGLLRDTSLTPVPSLAVTPSHGTCSSLSPVIPEIRYEQPPSTPRLCDEGRWGRGQRMSCGDRVTARGRCALHYLSLSVSHAHSLTDTRESRNPLHTPDLDQVDFSSSHPVPDQGEPQYLHLLKFYSQRFYIWD